MSDRPQFPGQHRDETVVFKKRRHWYILLKWLMPPLAIFFAAVGVGVGVGLALSLTALPWAGLIFLLCIGPLGFTIWRFLDWENDHYILTNQRVLHIERVYFLFESRQEANLDKVQDVTVRMPSLIANMLYFGDVTIETASKTGQIKFESIPKPRKIQRLIFEAAGLPEASMKEAEEWQAGRMRIMHPLKMFARMLYPVYPRGGDVRVWRKHWFRLLTKVIRPVLIALLVLVVWAAVLLSNLPAPVELIPEVAIVVIPAIILLILVGWIAWITIDWHNDLYVLTDTHVIDIEKKPFTSEFRREANLGMIQDVSYEQPTFLAKFLNYGNTRLETAGTMGEFTFDSIPNPRQVQEVIARRLADFRKRAGKTRPKPAPRTEEELTKALEKILNERYGLLPKPPKKQS
jgi:uncharacterized membrane protein YdbT with pleckstrin-like domain